MVVRIERESVWVVVVVVQRERALRTPCGDNLEMAPPSVMQQPRRRKALLCGISYAATPSARLQGCVNDAVYMQHLLVTKLGFQREMVFMLIDANDIDTAGSQKAWPTRKNIITAMKWLVSDMQPGDSLFFHYSGHGGRVRDTSGDELDGFDSTLLPCDFKTKGVIVDDEINSILVRPLLAGVSLHCVIDACHSGTVLDLEYGFMTMSQQQKWMHLTPSGSRNQKGTRGGFAVCFSSSSDAQVSADTTMFTGTNIATGAATYAFINAVEKGLASSYGSLLYAIQTSVHPQTRAQLEAQRNLLEPNRAQHHHHEEEKADGVPIKKQKKNVFKSIGNGFVNCFAEIAAPGSSKSSSSAPVRPPPVRPLSQDVQLTASEPFDLTTPFRL